MIHLYHDLKRQYPDIKYIPTTRLNQDVIENLFSVLREMGRHDNRMGPLAFKERLRNYILTGGHHFTSNNPNVKEAEKVDQLLIAEMTKDLVDEATFATTADDENTPENEPEAIEVEEPEIEEDVEISPESDEESESELAEEEGYKNMAKSLENVVLSPKKQTKKEPSSKKNTVTSDKFEGEEFINNSITAKLTQQEILPYVKKWDVVFRNYHKDAPEGEHGLLRTSGVIKGLELELLKNSRDLPPNLHPLLKEFAHKRTMIRLRHLKDILRSNIDESARSKNLQNYWQE